MSVVRLSEIVGKSFHAVHRQIKAGLKTHWWFRGGRGSLKSSFISIELVQGIMRFPDSHAVVFRKFGCDLRTSVYNQVLWAIDVLGVNGYFKATVSPMEITYLPTGQKIIFAGLDDPRKKKSQKMPFGYFRFAWFEELEQYDGMEEIRSVVQSYMRGGDSFAYFYSYNPPQTRSNWVNAEAEKEVHNRNVHTTTYLTAPRDWLGKEFFIEAEILKNVNEMAYRHEYLGEITGTGGTIFANVRNQLIPDSQIKEFNNLRKGIDWGFAVDPFAYANWHYDKTRRTIYIFDEIYKVGLLNDEAIDLVKKRNIGRDPITADSAEPKSIAEFRQAGINIRGAVKGKDSVRYGIKWLQKLHSIVIDKKRCPNAWKEFSLYEFERMKNGEFKSSYPDKDNHIIDLTRYGHEQDMGKRGMF